MEIYGRIYVDSIIGIIYQIMKAKKIKVKKRKITIL